MGIGILLTLGMGPLAQGLRHGGLLFSNNARTPSTPFERVHRSNGLKAYCIA
jgi:hypothetical protein